MYDHRYSGRNEWVVLHILAELLDQIFLLVRVTSKLKFNPRLSCKYVLNFLCKMKSLISRGRDENEKVQYEKK